MKKVKHETCIEKQEQLSISKNIRTGGLIKQIFVVMD